MTPEQVLALANSDSLKKSVQKIAKASGWLTLNANERAAWGEIKGSGREPYEVRTDLQETAFKCSCPSRQQPCKHGLALLLLYASEPTAFKSDAPPQWVTSWITARDAKRVKKETTEVVDPAAQAKRSAERESKVNAGIEELQLWLNDLIRSGLDGVQTRGYDFWDAPAARMVDAQAKGIANQLRDLAQIPQTGTGWVERLLERLSLLHLLAAGYRHHTALPPGLQTDVRSIVGWSQKQDELVKLPAVHDQWLVLAQRRQDENPGESLRTWLRGTQTGRDAMLLEFSFNRQPFEFNFPAGTCFEADLIYYPSGYPLRTLIKEKQQPLKTPPVNAIPLIEAISAYNAAIMQQPWLNLFPMLLCDVLPIRAENKWILRNQEGHFLALGAQIDVGWKLLALSGGHPLTIFGEWDGTRLLPLTVWVNNRILVL